MAIKGKAGFAPVKKDICAGVPCAACWRRATCPDSQCTSPSKEPILTPEPEPVKIYKRFRKYENRPVRKPAMYFGLAKRFGFRCQKCKTPELTVDEQGMALEIHHIEYRSNGGNDHISNLQLLCTKCHYETHGGVLAWQDDRPTEKYGFPLLYTEIFVQPYGADWCFYWTW